MTKELVDEKVTRHDDYCNDSPPNLTLPLKGGREQLGGNSGSTQSLFNVTDLTSYRLNVLTTSRKLAFTLAEVLITLAVIGIVAAMTIPNLVQSYKKKSTVVSIQKFYSVMSQALKLSEVEHGSVSTWTPPTVAHNGEALRQWWDIYMKDYFRCKDTTIKNNWFLADLGDGSGVGIKSPGTQSIGMQFYYCVNYKECLDNEFKITPSAGGTATPRNSFVFELNSKGVFKPIGRGNTREVLMNSSSYGCKTSTGASAHRYCAALIEYDGWKISDDYPW